MGEYFLRSSLNERHPNMSLQDLEPFTNDEPFFLLPDLSVVRHDQDYTSCLFLTSYYAVRRI